MTNHIRRFLPVAVLLAGFTRPLGAQTEDILRRSFEGKQVRIRMDMPGSEQGVDVYPGTSQKVNYPEHASRLKRFGTAIRSGDIAMITKIRLKGDHLEVHLDGGGYGTAGDETSSDVYVPTLEKTEREKNLEKELDKTTDPAVKKRLREELDALRKDRERQQARIRAEAAQAEAMKESVIRQKRLEGGSRFNLRYRDRVPVDELRPEAVMSALADFVDFGGRIADQRPPTTGSDVVRGLSIDQVEALLGRPESVTTRREGTLSVTTAVYLSGGRRLRAEYVEGILIRLNTVF